MSDMRKKLRQTTLSFASSAKRKMDDSKSDQKNKKICLDEEKSTDGQSNKNAINRTDEKTSEYFSTEKEDTRSLEQQEKSTKAADAALKRQNEKQKDEESKDEKASPKKSPVKKPAEKSVDPKAGTSVDPPADNDTLNYEMSDPNAGSEQTEDSQEVDDDLYPDIPTKKPSALRKESSWRGTKLLDLKATPECLGEIKPLGDPHHTVLFRLPYKFDEKDPNPPAPYPCDYQDKWDTDHVRMPCSKQNEYPVQGAGGKKVLRQRWDVINESLNAPIPGPYELEEAILQYNQRYANKWDFQAMKHFFTKYISLDERKKFFAKTLPEIVRLALQLPLLCTQPIPLLKQSKRHSITMSQQQAACLLANAFFCTFPRRNARGRNSEYSNYPEINFNILFQGAPNKRKMEKMKCIIHYFERIIADLPLGTLTFERKVINTFPNWGELGTDFCRLHVSASGTIEDNGKGMLQADFANKYLGGGVLGHGCVQEEIRFLICPEMILTRLFTEVLDRNETLLMSGCEQFSTYDGYADTFTWDGDFIDTTPRDIYGRRHVDVIAIDALVIRDYKKQFQKWSVERELNKAYCGFHSDYPGDQLSAVCTGNWGCGAFGGDKQLKALIQLMAASAAKRDVCYFTFDDGKLTDELYKIHNFITRENGLSVGNVMQLIDQYNRNVTGKMWFRKPSKTLFEYIVAVFDGTLDSDTGDDFSEGSLEGQAFDEDSNEGKKGLKRGDSVDYKANTP